ncbi:hypothetical protein L2K70_06235 [Nocardioides KLBMP 9356]|uniref:Uncharacterized protein n=1 Tax=Nocardioides potassii TaxID=2911371 RepID=A0ABS9HAD8_9ACTN|nr:hypothetical protein [Nocardioides potassii]MCF6377194.1 hypothetical protein [Nocardioides potassii]
MRRTTATALISALAAGLALAAPAGAAAPTTDLQPQRLERGPDVAGPSVEDGVFVDGGRRVDLPGNDGAVIGDTPTGWVVGTWRTNAVGERLGGRVVKVDTSGNVVTLARRVDPMSLVLGEDGSYLVGVLDPSRSRGTVTVWGVVSTDASPSGERGFRGYPEVLAVNGVKALIRTTTRTFWWNFARDEVRKPLTTKPAGPANVQHDLLQTFTKDPYLGGCAQVVRLQRPATVRWRSCRERVAAFSPDGATMITIGILTDGVGPGEVTLRRTDGKKLATWTTSWFDGWRWESPEAVLLDVNGARTSATVRCVLADCENATDPVKVQSP